MIAGPEPSMGEAVIGLGAKALGRLLPMHLCLDAEGYVRHAGPTIERLAGGALQGRHFDEVVTVRRPRVAADMGEFVALAGLPLKLSLVAAPDLALKGLIVPLPGDDGAVLNLSMGISLLEAVGRFDLTLRDFAPTDLAVELLYLIEAQSAVRDELRRLAQRLEGARVSAEEEAATDTLTGLANRRRLDATLDRFLAEGRPFALMHMDLDYFKRVNDTHGHQVGDAVLCEVARILRAEFRSHDLVARVGGDEFVILTADIVATDQLERIGRRLIARIEEPMRIDGIEARISASIGVAVATRNGTSDARRLMREADIALYASKGTGRARVSIHTPDPPQTPPGTYRDSRPPASRRIAT